MAAIELMSTPSKFWDNFSKNATDFLKWATVCHFRVSFCLVSIGNSISHNTSSQFCKARRFSRVTPAICLPEKWLGPPGRNVVLSRTDCWCDEIKELTLPFVSAPVFAPISFWLCSIFSIPFSLSLIFFHFPGTNDTADRRRGTMQFRAILYLDYFRYLLRKLSFLYEIILS